MTVNTAYWVGARDVWNTFVWVGTSEVLQDNSTVWNPGQPDHGLEDCVYLHKADGKLFDSLCTPSTYYVCESV